MDELIKESRFDTMADFSKLNHKHILSLKIIQSSQILIFLPV